MRIDCEFEDKGMGNTARRLLIQFILVSIVALLSKANEQEYRKSVDAIKESRVPEFLKRNLLEMDGRV